VDRLGRLDPPPTRHIPILIGGGGEKVTLRIVAEYADVWHTFGDQKTIEHKSKVLDEWGAKVGRDASAIERSIGVKPEQLQEAEAFRSLGVTEFTIGVTGPDLDLEPVKPWLKWRDSANGLR